MEKTQEMQVQSLAAVVNIPRMISGSKEAVLGCPSEHGSFLVQDEVEWGGSWACGKRFHLNSALSCKC